MGTTPSRNADTSSDVRGGALGDDVAGAEADLGGSDALADSPKADPAITIAHTIAAANAFLTIPIHFIGIALILIR